VLHAEAGSVEPDLIDSEVVSKDQVRAARLHTLRQKALSRLLLDILRYIERNRLCFTVPFCPSRERLDTS
jgi:hypothetical protein